MVALDFTKGINKEEINFNLESGRFAYNIDIQLEFKVIVGAVQMRAKL